MTKDEALRLALEALQSGVKTQFGRLDWIEYDIELVEEAITVIKAALEAKDEPVAWLHRFIEGGISIGLKPADLKRHPERWEPLYTEPKPCPTCEALARTVMLDQTSHDTTPPQRTWVGLTDEEIDGMVEITDLSGAYYYDDLLALARAIEARLKEKNT